MRKIKCFIKKILVKFHLLEEKAECEQPSTKKRPDFDIETRNLPLISRRSSSYECMDLQQKSPQIAIQIHAFFIEVMPEVVEILNNMPVSYDCYITTDTEEKKACIYKAIKANCSPHFLQIDVLENRGRDVGPFVQQMSPVIDKYDYIAHLHTKKSKHTDFGDDWRHFLYRNMFGGEENITNILQQFNTNPQIGLIIPEVYPIVRELMAWDNTKEDVAALLGKMNLCCELPDKPICPVGDIFWARVDAVKPLFELGLSQSDFQEEAGQLNYTLAHVIERIWCYLVLAKGYDYTVWINGREGLGEDEMTISRALLCAFSEPLSDVDGSMLKKMSSQFDYILVVLNQNVEVAKYPWLQQYSQYRTDEKSTGLMLVDTLAKKKADLGEYDEIAIWDNSLIGPMYDLKEIMDKMTEEKYSMWSLFKAPVLESSFSVFSLNRMRYEDLMKIVLNNQILDTAYIKESSYIGEWLFVEKPILELCFDFIILHSPFVKKQSLSYLPKNEKKLVKSFLKEICNEER